MSFLADKCTFEVLSKNILEESLPFTCGDDKDMDEFFSKDAMIYANRKIGKSYCFRLEKDPPSDYCMFHYFQRQHSHLGFGKFQKECDVERTYQ